MEKFEKKYTPGPWDLITDEEEVYYAGGGLPFIKVADQRHIRVVGRSLEEAVANATLIAAAPELLEALEIAMESIAPNDKEAFDICNRALAKAYGKEVKDV